MRPATYGIAAALVPGVLFALGVVLAAALAGLATSAPETPVVDAVQAHEAARSGELTIVDIRRPAEWRETGVPQSAALVSMHSPRGLQGLLDGIAKLTGGDKTTPLALICAGGVRSSYAAAVLRASGYTNVSDIGEGILGSAQGPGWVKRRLPMVHEAGSAEPFDPLNP